MSCSLRYTSPIYIQVGCVRSMPPAHRHTHLHIFTSKDRKKPAAGPPMAGHPPACCSLGRSTEGRTSRRPSRSCCSSVRAFPGCPSWGPSRSSSGIYGCGPARPCRRGSGGSGDCGACGGRGIGPAFASCGSSSCACTAGHYEGQINGHRKRIMF